MKKTLILALGLTTFSQAYAADPQLKTLDQKVSYTLGIDLAKNFKKQGLNIDVNALVLGMKDAINKAPLKMTEAEMKAAVLAVKKQLIEKSKKERQKQAEANAKAGEAFLAKNKTKPGVKVLKSGLQYKILVPGKGAPAKATDYITANYEGRLINGTVFDSSYQRGNPIEFQMTDVIKGWGEALKIMKPGSTWEIYVPPALGYGAKGAGQAIGPNETLIFKIEFIKADKEKPTR